MTISNRGNNERAPILGDDVELGAYAQILGSVRAGFDAGDNAFDAAPTRGSVKELLEATRLAVFRRGIEARFRAGLKIPNMPAQCRG